MIVSHKLSFKDIESRINNIKKNPPQNDNTTFKFTAEQIQASWKKVISNNEKYR